MSDHCLQVIGILIQALVAVGTIGAVVWAIFQDQLRLGPKISIDVAPLPGFPTPGRDDRRVYFYQLGIRNERPKVPARHARVMCVEIQKKRRDGKFTPEPYTPPVQLTWCYTESHERFPTISKEDLCDIGHVFEGDTHFFLGTYCCYREFPGKISAGETMRIGVELSADNYFSPSLVWFEISWDGQWSSDAAEMQRHLIVTKA